MALSRSTAVPAAVLAGLAYFALALAWAVTVPPYRGIDEFSHAFRASAVASGEWQSPSEVAPHGLGRGHVVRVRRDIVSDAEPACVRLPYTLRYDCHPIRGGTSSHVDIVSSASNYNPVYYGIVGSAVRPFHGLVWLYAARLASAVLVAALFGLAWWCTGQFATTRWPYVALLACLTPTVLYSSALLAPNALNMVAGLTLWSALLALARPRADAHRPTVLYWIAALSVVTMANTHTLGLLWLGLIVLTLGLMQAPTLSQIRAWWSRQRRFAALPLVVAAAGAMVAFAWVALAHPNEPGTRTNGSMGHLWLNLPSQIPLWPLQGIGAIPFRDTPTNVVVIVAFAFALLLLVAAALTLSVRQHADARNALLACLVLSFAVPFALSALTYSTLGTAWQGRYGLPYTFGLLVLSGFVLDRARLHNRFAHSRLAFVTLAPLGVVTCQLTAQLYEIGQENASGDWTAQTWLRPPVWSLAAAAVTAFILLVAALRSRPGVFTGSADQTGIPVKTQRKLV